MKLSINNVGPFVGRHEIKIDGITVLAGINGCGKSTFGKALYTVFSAFYNIENQVEKEREASLKTRLLNYFIHLSRNISLRSLNNKVDDIVENILSGGDIRKSFDVMASDIIVDDEEKEILIERCNEIFELNNEVIKETILANIIDSEFGEQFVNLNSQENWAKVELCIKNKKISFECNKDDITIDSSFALAKDIVYIDDPNVLDSIDNRNSFYDVRMHKENLRVKLGEKTSTQFAAVDQILIYEKIKRIEEKISIICDGEVKSTEGRGYRYISDRYKEGLDVENMATGLKSFAVLKMLLQKGYLQENGVVIFDEPEIHLHPEWQKVWAEIIVLLNKDLGINVLLSTHSADFLSFLELYIRKYEIGDKCNTYLLHSSDNSSGIEDVSEKWDEIYGRLGKPFIAATEELEVLNEG